MNFEQKYVLEVELEKNKAYRLECPAGTTWPEAYAAISKMSAFAFSNLKKLQEEAEEAEEPKEVAEEKVAEQAD